MVALDSIAVTVCDNHQNGEIDKITEEECLNKIETKTNDTVPSKKSDFNKIGCDNESFSKSESAVSVEIEPECNENIEQAEQSDTQSNHKRNTIKPTNNADNDDDDITNTKLWQVASLAHYWPANDINSLIRQTIIRCNDTFNGKHTIQTGTIDYIDYNNVMIMCSKLSGNKEVIL